MTAHSGRGAAEQYIGRKQQHQFDIEEYRRREDRISWARLACGVILAAVVIAVFGPRWLPAVVLPVPLLGFLALLVVHDRVRRGRQSSERAVRYYEHGLARVSGDWAAFGVTGEAYLPADHLYAGDLDLFGPQSLFQLLCRCRTGAGQRTLARWLCRPADPDEIGLRQEAVQELAAHLQLREDLALLGEEVAQEVHPGILTAWAADESRSELAPLAPWAPALAAVAVLAVGAWIATWIGTGLLMVILAAEAAFAWRYRTLVSQVVETVQEPQRELTLLARVLRRLEREEFRSVRLRELTGQISGSGGRPSDDIARLALLVSLLDQRRNQFFQPIAALLLWATQLTARIEIWRQASGARVPDWLDAVGQIEALVSLATFSFENEDSVFPEIVADGPLWKGAGLCHPLLPSSTCVANDVALGDGKLRLMVVSGSNMSGKTTLLRTVGINTVLALAGGPVRASSLRLCPVHIGATLRIQDSLQRGQSRFYAEVTRIQEILKLTGRSRPVLFLFDELFSGTNSHDRRIGSRAVIETLLERGAVGLLTTHDLALTEIASRLEPAAANYHFQDRIEDGQMVFDYLMRSGVVQRSNALQIMLAAGLDIEAERVAGDTEESTDGKSR